MAPTVPLSPAELEWFLARTKLVEWPLATPCWIWTGSMWPNGYGLVRVKGRTRYAHRLAYEEAIGEIRGRAQVNHHCDQKACIAPDHLFLGSHKINARDAASKGRLARKLRPGNILEMRELHAAGRSMRSLSAQFGVARFAVELIVTGRSWRHLNGDFVPAPTRRVSPTCPRGHVYDGEYTSPTGVWCRTCSICIRLNKDIQTARRRAARQAGAA